MRLNHEKRPTCRVLAERIPGRGSHYWDEPENLASCRDRVSKAYKESVR